MEIPPSPFDLPPPEGVDIDAKVRVMPTLDASPERRMIFDRLAALAPGDNFIVVSAHIKGPLGKRELISFRSWLLWERRRWKRLNLARMQMGAFLGEADPLQGLSTYLECGSDDVWHLHCGKPKLTIIGE